MVLQHFLALIEQIWPLAVSQQEPLRSIKLKTREGLLSSYVLESASGKNENVVSWRMSKGLWKQKVQYWPALEK